MGELRKARLQTNYGTCYACPSPLGLRCKKCRRFVCEQHGEHMGDHTGALCLDCYRQELRRRDSIGQL